MEVHAHQHTQGRKWTHYLWEFLMLFLAVFCGFLAENFREHQVEHRRAKQFAISLISDLKEDTTALNIAIDLGNKKIRGADSLIAQLDQPIEKWKDTLIYTYSGITGRARPFGHNSSTYEQMKASGSLRYFKPELTDLLNQYDVQAIKAKVREDFYLDYTRNYYNPFTIGVIDMISVIQIQDGHLPTRPLVFRKTDKETIALWINYAAIVQSTQERAIVEYIIVLEKAKQLLTTLKKEYRIE